MRAPVAKASTATAGTRRRHAIFGGTAIVTAAAAVLLLVHVRPRPAFENSEGAAAVVSVWKMPPEMLRTLQAIDRQAEELDALSSVLGTAVAKMTERHASTQPAPAGQTTERSVP